MKVFFLVLLSILLPSIVLAQNRAGVIVRHESSQEKSACVSFNEDFISGFELLSRGGLHPVLDRGFIVEIDGERAKSAWDPNVGNNYWSYWVKKDSWIYARAGATSNKVYPGQLDGWQKGGGESHLSNATFSTVCPPIEEKTNPNQETQTSNQTADQATVPGPKTDTQSQASTSVNQDQSDETKPSQSSKPSKAITQIGEVKGVASNPLTSVPKDKTQPTTTTDISNGDTTQPKELSTTPAMTKSATQKSTLKPVIGITVFTLFFMTGLIIPKYIRKKRRPLA